MLLAFVPLFACAPIPRPSQDLGAACQLAKCICADPEAPFWQKVPTAEIRWSEAGRAFCPDGYVLRRGEAKE